MIGPVETGLKLHAPSDTGFVGPIDGTPRSPATPRKSITLIRGHTSPGDVEKRLTFAYGRTLVTSRIFVLASLAVLAAIVIVLLSSPVSAVLGLAALLAAYLVLFTLSPLLTQHWITRSRVILRQGWYFRAVIPFSAIEQLQAADDAVAFRTPLGISRPFGQPVLFVTGGRTNLVRVRLQRPRRFWQAFGLSASEIVFDVRDRGGFLAAFEERRRLLPPVQSNRARADLGD
jgi:hypothetical protein